MYIENQVPLMTPECTCAKDTFWTLLHDWPHWEFELFLMLLFDGVIGALAWPFIQKHWKHHLERDNETKSS